jgi:hypothetical protein
MSQQPVSGWMNEGDSNHSLSTPDVLAPIEHGLTTLVCATVAPVILDEGKLAV